MALSTFALLQSYLTALILVIAAVFWFKVRRSYDVTRIRINKLYNAILLIVIPFIFRIIRFIPADFNIFLQHLLLLFVMFMVAFLVIKNYKASDAQRTKDLRELLEASHSHPIRLEFARRIVQPEYEKIIDERRKLGREQRILAYKEKKSEDAFKKIEQEEARLKTLRENIAKEQQTAKNAEQETKKKELNIKAKESELGKKIADAISEKEKYLGQKKALDEKEAKLEQEYKEFRQKLLQDTDHKVDDVKKTYLEKTKRKEQSLLTWEKEIENYERRVKDRESTLKNLDDKAREISSDYEKLKRLEIKMKGERIDLDARKSQVRKEAEDLARAKDQFLDEKDRAERIAVKGKKMIEESDKERVKLKQKEENLLRLQDSIERRARDVEKKERKLGVKPAGMFEAEHSEVFTDKKKKRKEDNIVGHVTRLFGKRGK